ncbi:MAG: nucleoside triphosphate pyrophosphohydrolase family protein [Thaumarchaeota archaeon]|nr:nucleoside triphosphate pyrophosphohydrolase family protein [Nitrososphaerota archaeon]
MNLNEYQKNSRGTARYKRGLTTIDGLTYSVLALCGEAGELANKLKKSHRTGTKPDELVLADELGDVLWYVASVAHELGMDLEYIAQMNLEKLQQRIKANKQVG